MVVDPIEVGGERPHQTGGDRQRRVGTGGGAQLVGGGADRGQVEIALGGEVVVQQRLRHPSGGGDIGHRHLVPRPGADEVQTCLHQLAPSVIDRQAPTATLAIDHV